MASTFVSFKSLPIPPQDSETTYDVVIQRATEFEKKEAEHRKKKYHNLALNLHTMIQNHLSSKKTNQWPTQMDSYCDFFHEMSKKEKTELEGWLMKSFLNYTITLTNDKSPHSIQITISPEKN